MSTAETKKYIIYKRLSKESKSGGNLGLEAQQHSIDNFLKYQTNYEILQTVEEIETGTKKRKRPLFTKAVEDCQKFKATLLIAKLDRMSRDLGTVLRLQESKVDFLALDMRDASPLTIHIFSAIAQHEAKMISTRTTDALAALKARGIKLGPKHKKLTAQDSEPYRKELNEKKKRTAYEFADRIFPVLKYYKDLGLNQQQIASELNIKSHSTPSGKGKWSATTVSRCYNRVERAASC